MKPVSLINIRVAAQKPMNLDSLVNTKVAAQQPMKPNKYKSCRSTTYGIGLINTNTRAAAQQPGKPKPNLHESCRLTT